MEKIMSDKPNNSERLEKLCGFDPTKKLNATGELLAEVAEELKKERETKAKDSAREQLRKAVELREKMHNVRKEFEGQTAKFDKELGNLLSRLEVGLRGQPVKEEPTSKE
jgi:alanyl-tRNA synthetase